jgi:hypothetical protein
MFSIVTYPLLFNDKQRRLMTTLDSYDLENKWIPENNVKCLSGDIAPVGSTFAKTSHCSCFVYRVCKDLNVKMIGTEEGYSQYKLATNQLQWLNSNEAKKEGWKKIEGSVPDIYLKANREAVAGNLVIAGIEDDDDVLGHISIIRPSTRENFLIKRDGPDTIASSKVNSHAVFLRDDFLFTNKDMEKFENRLQIFSNSNV